MELFGKPFRPLLAGKADVMQLRYPVGVTPKIDGIRVICLDGVAYSRSLKPIRNKAIQAALADLPSGCDGEIIATSGSFQDSTSCVMSSKSDIPWKYHIFDYLDPETGNSSTYGERVRQLEELAELGRLNEHCTLVLPEYVYDRQHLTELCEQHLADGYEGTMVRHPGGRYKFGRSTTNEQILLKIKQFADAEAVITGFEELQHNENELKEDALGYAERSHSKDGKVAGATLGAFVVHLLEDTSITFKIGTGMTAAERQEYWNNQDELLGKTVKFKYFEIGVKQAPRHPVLLGFRDADDM